MRKYYVVNGELSFGFAGFIRKACTSMQEAEFVVSTIKNKYSNLSKIDIEIVEAKNKKEAESKNRKSMYAGEFAGADNVNI